MLTTKKMELGSIIVILEISTLVSGKTGSSMELGSGSTSLEKVIMELGLMEKLKEWVLLLSKVNFEIFRKTL